MTKTKYYHCVEGDNPFEVEKIWRTLHEGIPPPQLIFSVNDPHSHITYKGIQSMLLPDNQKFTATISAKSAAGNPATLDESDNPITWESSDPNIVSVTPSSDRMSAEIAAAGPVGMAQITVRADADVDPGEIRELAGILEVEVISGEAVTIEVVPGPLEDQ
jgi:hypothetical protein